MPRTDSAVGPVGALHDEFANELHDWKSLANAAGQAAITVVVAYFHNRVKPAK